MSRKQRRKDRLPKVEGQHGHAEQKRRRSWVPDPWNFASECHLQNIESRFIFPAMAVKFGHLSG